ncbi:hypothetical protein SUGI_0603440 [Cryptomeria japonica]|nr:hypothetical protein SUGI_0603440 [Cryptomeria japonica]
MAARGKYSESSEQYSEQSQRGKTRSWLFGGWMSKSGEEESTHKNNSAHVRTEKSSNIKGGRTGRASSHDDADSNSPNDPVQRKKKTATFADMEDDHHAEKKNEDNEVDKYAEDFIDKQKSKLEMERLISMKS